MSAVLYGLGMSCFQAVDFSLAMDCLANQNETATALGLWNLCYMFGMSAGALFIGGMLWMFPSSSDAGSEHDGSGYLAYFFAFLGCQVALGICAYYVYCIQRTAPRKFD